MRADLLGIRIGQSEPRLLTEGLDVQGAAGSHVDDAFGQLSRAGLRIGAAVVDVALFGRGQLGAAGRAVGGEDEVAQPSLLLLALLALGQDRAEDLGDDITGFADPDLVPDLEVLGLDHILVVQRGLLHGGSGHQHRLQHGEGGHPARPAHLDPDVEQLRRLLLGRILIGGRPAGHPGGVAQCTLEVEVVDFDDHAVDLVDELMPPGLEAIQVVVDLLHTGEDLGIGTDRQPPGGQLVIGLMLGAQCDALAGSHAVDEHRQRTLSGLGRILLTQRACGGVARVGELLLAGVAEAFIECAELGGGHEDLPADLEFGGMALAGELVGDLIDGQHIMGDVLTGGAVTAGGRTDQLAAAVEQVDGQAVDLDLHQPPRAAVGGHAVRAKLLQGGDRTVVPGVQLLPREDVLQRVHPLDVLHRGEGGGDLSPDLLGGGIGRDDLGVLGLDLFQTPPELIELGVGDHRSVLLVVGDPMLPDLLDQLLVLLTQLACGRSPVHGGGLRRRHLSTLTHSAHSSPAHRHAQRPRAARGAESSEVQTPQRSRTVSVAERVGLS